MMTASMFHRARSRNRGASRFAIGIAIGVPRARRVRRWAATVTVGAAAGALAGALSLVGCNSGLDTAPPPTQSASGFRDNLTPGTRDNDKNVLTDPTVDYMSALRTAAIRLTAGYPTLAEIKQLQAAADRPTTYAQLVDSYLSRPSFAAEQIAYWRDTMKLVGNKSISMTNVNLDAAPTFAASLVVGEQPITQLFTAQKGTCPSFNAATGAFAAADCGTTKTAGVLTDPGMNSQMFSSLGFRRARWTIEVFTCHALPVEQSGTPVVRPGGTYASPWPENSISGGASARVNFLDDSQLVCANCHSTMNHFAPLLGYADLTGKPTAAFSVVTPIAGNPTSVLTDWLPAGQGFAWRYGKPVSDIVGLGQAIAEDPMFAQCMATRAWNWAFGRGDAVVDNAVLTPELATQLTTSLVQNNYNMKKLLRQVFTSDSFVRF